ncbi:MAG: electron transporter RnfD [Gammaproteobacteria bacterium SG8_11]|nr:MAG: electron transporter RnfD [Gammaproteobacteria bacterium SG8_11]
MSNKTLQIHSSPHISNGASVDVIMRNVVYALFPVVGFSIYAFGLAAFFTIIFAVLACLLTEHLLCRWSKQTTTVNDWSVAITGIIYGLTLPPGLPLWMTVVGGVLAVSLGKFIFGGLGCNPFNPALVGRAFLQAAFPTAMTSWMAPFASDRFTTIPTSTLALPLFSPTYDSLSSATPLAAMKFSQQSSETVDLLLGLTSGSLGETCSVLILLGGLYLIVRNMMNWRIPAGIFIAVILLSAVFHFIDPVRFPNVVFMLFTGGLMLGAMFMATDMVASPITNVGCFIYGLLIGALVVVIRLWSGMPEGVMYAILFANAVSPHIDRYFQPTPFGHQG